MTHFEEKLILLKREITTMFVLVHSQISKAKQAVLKFDKNLANEIVQTEKRVNEQEIKIDRDCENILALYQPVAVDLRYLIAVLKINSNLERSGDIAKSVAKFVIKAEKPINQELAEQTELMKMFDELILICEDIENAFTNENAGLAMSIFKQDEAVDIINKQAIKNISNYIRNHPDNIEEALKVFNMIKKLERVGDQAKNIAEEIIFYLEAKVLKHSGKKSEVPKQ